MSFLVPRSCSAHISQYSPVQEERWLRDMQVVHHHIRIAAERDVMRQGRRSSLASLASSSPRRSRSALNIDTVTGIEERQSVSLPQGVTYDADTDTVEMRLSRLLLYIQELDSSKSDDMLLQGLFHFKMKEMMHRGLIGEWMRRHVHWGF